MSLLLCMVWGCILTSLIYMQLSNFTDTTCSRDRLFPIVYYCLLCWILIDLRCVGLFLGSLFYFIPLIYMFLCQYHTALITVAFSLGGLCILLYSFPLYCFGNSGFFKFHINFSITCSVKNTMGNLKGIPLNL